MLEIAANEELRLFRRDIEGRLCRLDRIWDFLHVRLETAETDSPIEESRPAP